MSDPGAPADRPPSAEPTLAGGPPATDPSRPPSDEDTLIGEGAFGVAKPASRAADPQVIGRYEVLGRIGEGGMGLIYAAKDPELDRKVAVKLVRPALESSGSDARARLLREAQALAKVSHPNVIHVYEVGTFEDQVYVAMEFIEGGTLRDWQWQPHVSWRAIIEAYVGAARGLSAAHDKGLVHRDFKPDNVLVTQDDSVRVIDFGLARTGHEAELPAPDADAIELVEAATLDLGRLMTRLTKTGAILGTPAYMAPEQHEGQGTDARTDQFAFCVSLYEALYGMRPFAGDSYPVLVRNVLEGRVEEEPRFVEVPPSVRAALLRGLAVDPAKRFKDMDALVQALRRDPHVRRRRFGIVAGVLTAGVGGGLLYSSAQEDRATREAGVAIATEFAEHRRAQLEAQAAAGIRNETSSAANRGVIALAKTKLGSDATAAAAALANLHEPTPQTLAAARMLVGDALRVGIRKPFVDAAPGVELLATSANAEHLVLARDGIIKSFEMDQLRWEYTSSRRLTALEMGSDGLLAFGGTEDGALLIWPTRREEAPSQTKLHNAAITALASDARGENFASGDKAGHVMVWHLEDERPVVDRHVDKHTGSIRSLSFSPSGELLASAAEDGQVIRWKLADRTNKSYEPGSVSIASARWADEDWLYVLGSDGRLTQWSPDSGSQLGVATGVHGFTMIGEEPLALDAAGGVLVSPRPLAAANLGPGIEGLHAAKEGHLLSVDEAGRVATWTVRSSQRGFTEGELEPAVVRVAPKGELVAVATRTGEIVVWRDGAEPPVFRSDPLGAEPRELEFSPDARRLAWTDATGALRVLELADGAIAELPAQEVGELNSIVWRPDSAGLAGFGCRGICGALLFSEPWTDFPLRAEGFDPQARGLVFAPDSASIYLDPVSSPPRLADLGTGEEETVVWTEGVPAERIAEAWTDQGGLRVVGRDAEGSLGVWQYDARHALMQRAYRGSEELALVDRTRRNVLLGSPELASLWSMNVDTWWLSTSLPDAVSEMKLRTTGDWMLLVDAEADQSSILAHLPTHTTSRFGAVATLADLGNDGTIIDPMVQGVGRVIRRRMSPVPQSWPVLQAWLGAVTGL